MATSAPTILVYGPAYRDLLVDVATALVPSALGGVLDQSAPAETVTPRADGHVRVTSPAGEWLMLTLPPSAAGMAATYALQRPIRPSSDGASPPVLRVEAPVVRVREELGGMGAGYAAALGGRLRAPFGVHQGVVDAVGRQVGALLAHYGIACAPRWLEGHASDESLVILSPAGDKLAVGVRDALAHWTLEAADDALLASAAALVCCGAPNRLVADLLARAPARPVLCAPALRNVSDRALPLAELAPSLHLLTLNAHEWGHLADQDAVRAHVPVIAITQGAHGSRLLVRGEEEWIPAVPVAGQINTNRAGETYGATLFAHLLREEPEFWRTGGPSVAGAVRAARQAACQAARQLQISGFGFPPLTA
jgi:sugar/nucleoside kinase (ribokinase family)